MKLTALFPVVLVLLLACSAALCQEQANSTSVGATINVETVEIAEMPARISMATLKDKGGRYIVKCSISNVTEERLKSVQFLLFSFDGKGNLVRAFDLAMAVDLAPYDSAMVSVRVDGAKDIATENRTILVVRQVIGEASIWIAAKLENSIKAYALGNHLSQPVVRRMNNTQDSPIN